MPSPVGGIAIIAGTAVGAGMFSLPIASAGMGFLWAAACLLLTWILMVHSALLILEINLNFPVGSSFNTFVRGTLGSRWNAVNNLSLVFVLYILCYAFISAGGSIVSHTLAGAFDINLNIALAGTLFSALVAVLVWMSTAVVSRVCTLLIVGMVLSFAYTISRLSQGIDTDLLLDSGIEYAAFSFIALPIYLTAFGFHTSIPSLMKYYGKEPRRILQCVIIGSLLSLTVYIIWQAVTLGQLSRDELRNVIAEGSNIGPMVAAISRHSDNSTVLTVLEVFANFAVITSFVGAGLGLFDYIADAFKFDDNALGRLKSAGLAFLPPTLACLIFPNGFIYAIGYAAFFATVMTTFMPAAAAYKGRKTIGNPQFRVWGGNSVLLMVVAYGCLIVVCHVLGMLGYLPEFN